MGIVAAAVCFHGGTVPGDVLGYVVGRGILAEQKIEASVGDVADRAFAAGTHPDAWVRFLG
jgi:hypothetical protein